MSRPNTLFFISLCILVLSLACGRTFLIQSSIDLTEWIDADDRTFSLDITDPDPDFQHTWLDAPVVEIQLSEAFEEYVVTDEILIFLGLESLTHVSNGDIDLSAEVSVYISEFNEPEIWEEEPLYTLDFPHFNQPGGAECAGTLELAEDFRNLIHSGVPLFLGLQATASNQGGTGQYSGSIIATHLRLDYIGHREF
ncbi:MAG: hypothetical protein QF492_08580 [Candidatus Krumholzibacteria bacterium]|nr:hypothetical protein [Candidatus Krumholzibacteria bacterium]